MTAILRDINNLKDPLPEFLIIDTSIILELYTGVPTTKNHNQIISFLDSLRKASLKGDTIPLLPYIVLEELYFRICQIELTKLASMDGKRWHDLYKEKPELIKKLHPKLENMYKILQAFPMIILEPEDLVATSTEKISTIADQMTEYILKYLLLPKDATILSESNRIGVYYVATLDSDWKRADGFTVYLPM